MPALLQLLALTLLLIKQREGSPCVDVAIGASGDAACEAEGPLQFFVANVTQVGPKFWGHVDKSREQWKIFLGGRDPYCCCSNPRRQPKG